MSESNVSKRAFRTHKLVSEMTPEEIELKRAYFREYYANNKQRFVDSRKRCGIKSKPHSYCSESYKNSKWSDEIDCDVCQKKITLKSLKRHMKSKTHLKALEKKETDE